jgi:hypothetical protein
MESLSTNINPPSYYCVDIMEENILGVGKAMVGAPLEIPSAGFRYKRWLAAFETDRHC